ncbi:MAG TPA: DNA polymerase Y family protein [Actinoplanes sp.]|nr:DNA polymerase Y family protein [Actinoplanes sp.]
MWLCGGGAVEVGVRTLLVWCPDWPVVAAGIVGEAAVDAAVAVMFGNRVLACSEAARREGVRRGLRRREAQGRCPRLVVVEHDPGRDARAFEPVVAAVEEVVAGVEVLRPGVCAVAARGPARYFGGEEAAAERIVEQVALVTAVECQIGIADGLFAAGIAARTGLVVPAGTSRDFLYRVPIESLEEPQLTDLLKRLGIRSLGDFAALPPGDVLTRFGFEGALAHRLASGADHRPLAVRRPPPDLAVEEIYDDVLDRVDVAAFAGRVLAERLHERLAAYGLACTRLGIEAVTADGQELFRVWRHDGLLSSAAIAERVRWQLDGWLTGARRGQAVQPTAGLVRLRLVPDGVLAHAGLQPGLWGEAGDDRERAHRAFSRVQGMLGPEAVLTPVLGGGRSGDDQVRLVPWGDERVPERPAAEHTDPVPGVETAAVLDRDDRPPLRLMWTAAETQATETQAAETQAAETQAGGEKAGGEDGFTMIEVGRRKRTGTRPPVLPPWPGRLPKPAPAIVLPHPLPAAVYDEGGQPVTVSARLEVSGIPAVLRIARRAPVVVTGWAGPWPVDERWWAAAESRRRARFQMVLEDGRALLLSLSGGRWTVEAVYD